MATTAGDQKDSPLSIASNVVGILTFVVAIAAASYARVMYLRNSDDEYFRVKTSLSWYKTESAWLVDLLAALDAQHDGAGKTRRRPPMRVRGREHQMYAFVMEDLLNLEQRLLDLVIDVEARASPSGMDESGFALVPRRWQGGRPSVAMAWLTVRTKALELVRQREALTARVQFLHMSMISSRLGDLEAGAHRSGDSASGEGALTAQDAADMQRKRIRRLEVLVERMAAQGATFHDEPGSVVDEGVEKS